MADKVNCLRLQVRGRSSISSVVNLYSTSISHDIYLSAARKKRNQLRDLA